MPLHDLSPGTAPGLELAYAQVTVDTSITATTEGAADTIVTAVAIVLDGSTTIEVIFFSQQVQSPGAAASRFTSVVLYDAVGGAAAASIGGMGLVFTDASARTDAPFYCSRRLTPAAGSHVYSARAYVNAGTGTVNAGTGASGTEAPAFIQVKQTSL